MRTFIFGVFVIGMLMVGGGMAMAFELTSADIEAGKRIDERFTCEKQSISPALAWWGAPVGTKSFALIADDPDAPAKVWVHWLVYDIPVQATELPRAISGRPNLLAPAKQGRNDSGDIGYSGPYPPPGPVHHYYFRLYALDTVLGLAEGASREELEAEMKGHVLAETSLMGTYQR
jgi:Raf kinase inhibitor-like YbhB/YbcL family protein